MFGTSTTAFAASNQARKKGVVITKIRANFIDVKRKVETISLTGNVVVERDDISITANNMLVYYFEDKSTKKKIPKKIISNTDKDAQDEQEVEENKAPKNTAPKNTAPNNTALENKTMNSSIKKIEATNNVKVFNDEFVATGTYGFYSANQNNIILEKNVTFNNGTSVAHGEKFVYDLKTKKGNMVGTGNPAKPTNHQADSDDGRVIVIIDDSTIKQSQKNSQKPNSQ